MILVDIEVPMLDVTYDFELDEEVPVRKLTNEIIDLIRQAQGLGEKIWEEMYLYCFRLECILNQALSLKEQGIQTGDKLILL